MKNIGEILLVLILGMSFSCTKHVETVRSTTCSDNNQLNYPEDRGEPELCASDTCNVYFDIWKALVMEKNNLSPAFFDAHIEPQYSGIHDWSKGSSFRICYHLKVDWAVTYVCDKFIININPDDDRYPLLNLPKGVNLSEEDIITVTENRAYSSSISKINNTDELIALSLEDALNELITFADTDPLCFNRVELDRHTGNLTLKAFAEYEHEDNACISAEIDLITGEKTTMETPCRI